MLSPLSEAYDTNSPRTALTGLLRDLQDLDGQLDHPSRENLSEWRTERFKMELDLLKAWLLLNLYEKGWPVD